MKVTIPCLSKNNITTLNSWTALEEAVMFLHRHEESAKVQVLHQQIALMAPVKVGTRLYNAETVVKAFDFFVTSRALYSKLRNEYKLPSIRTLTRITSSISKQEDSAFLEGIFKSLIPEQRICVLLHDEVYIKKTLTYHGGTVFGKAANDPSVLAGTMLGIMVNNLHGGPKFLERMIPVSKLNADYLYSRINSSIELIENAGCNVQVIICDGNRTNQSFFKKFDTVPNKPWLTHDGKFLLYDYVHLIKNLRNLWLTEITGQLEFMVEGETFVAHWKHLRDLYKFETDDPSCMKMSMLDEISVYPKVIERQRVQPCLNVFSEKTSTALQMYGDKRGTDVCGTVKFLQTICHWWKILNVKRKGIDMRYNDALQAVISNPNDSRLKYIENFGEMCLRMAGKQGSRVRQLSKDTANSVHTTCMGLVELSKYLLEEKGYKYVCLGEFSTDPLEKAFSKFRQGSGGTYFINAQQITEKIRICRAKLQLKMNSDLLPSTGKNGHNCIDCSYSLDEKASESFDQLPDLEASVTTETKQSLVYIAGYLTRKASYPNEDEDSYDYYERYGQYINKLNRGSLKTPGDIVCQWTFLCFIIFNIIKTKICRTSLKNIFLDVANHYGLHVHDHYPRILANIFINNYCSFSTPRSQKESQQKILKLS